MTQAPHFSSTDSGAPRGVPRTAEAGPLHPSASEKIFLIRHVREGARQPLAIGYTGRAIDSLIETASKHCLQDTSCAAPRLTVEVSGRKKRRVTFSLPEAPASPSAALVDTRQATAGLAKGISPYGCSPSSQGVPCVVFQSALGEAPAAQPLVVTPSAAAPSGVEQPLFTPPVQSAAAKSSQTTSLPLPCAVAPYLPRLLHPAASAVRSTIDSGALLSSAALPVSASVEGKANCIKKIVASELFTKMEQMALLSNLFKVELQSKEDQPIHVVEMGAKVTPFKAFFESKTSEGCTKRRALNQVDYVQLLPKPLSSLAVWINTQAFYLANPANATNRQTVKIHRAFGLMTYYLQLLSYAKQDGRLTIGIAPSKEQLGVGLRSDGFTAAYHALLPNIEDNYEEVLKTQLRQFIADYALLNEPSEAKLWASENRNIQLIFKLISYGISLDQLFELLENSAPELFADSVICYLPHDLRIANGNSLLYGLSNMTYIPLPIMNEVDQFFEKRLSLLACEYLKRVIGIEGADPDLVFNEFLGHFSQQGQLLKELTNHLDVSLKDVWDLSSRSVALGDPRLAVVFSLPRYQESYQRAIDLTHQWVAFSNPSHEYATLFSELLTCLESRKHALSDFETRLPPPELFQSSLSVLAGKLESQCAAHHEELRTMDNKIELARKVIERRRAKILHTEASITRTSGTLDKLSMLTRDGPREVSRLDGMKAMSSWMRDIEKAEGYIKKESQARSLKNEQKRDLANRLQATLQEIERGKQMALISWQSEQKSLLMQELYQICAPSGPFSTAGQHLSLFNSVLSDHLFGAEEARLQLSLFTPPKPDSKTADQWQWAHGLLYSAPLAPWEMV